MLFVCSFQYIYSFFLQNSNLSEGVDRERNIYATITMRLFMNNVIDQNEQQ